MGMMKVFSGSEILANALQAKIEEAGVKTITKKCKSSRFWDSGHCGGSLHK